MLCCVRVGFGLNCYSLQLHRLHRSCFVFVAQMWTSSSDGFGSFCLWLMTNKGGFGDKDVILWGNRIESGILWRQSRHTFFLFFQWIFEVIFYWELSPDSVNLFSHPVFDRSIKFSRSFVRGTWNSEAAAAIAY
jgi:hypothetical protein